MSKRVTSIEVAQRAGVSQSTVSRVFGANGLGVSEEKRQRVLEAARAMGYHPSALASSLSRQATNTVGLVMANMTSPFYPYVLEKFLLRLQAMERQALLFTVAPTQDVDDVLSLVFQHHVDALIVTSAMLSSRMAEQCYAWGLPVILFNRYGMGAHVDAVSCDNREGGRRTADVLLDAGHERLGYIAGTPNTSTNIDRERGFTERLRERGVTLHRRAQGDFTYASGAVAAAALLASPDRPDALFCANDIMALGAMDAARAHGLRVPHDLSIMGFDDIPMAGWEPYRLTTIRQEVDEMIEATLALMQSKLDAPEQPPQIRLIEGTLIVRDSVRGLRTGEEHTSHASAR
jgi:DNA-binding LacI/PurR family transcriptional regulator